MEDLIAMTRFSDDEDTDSIVAPSEISFFTDHEDDDMTAVVSTNSEVYTVQEQTANPL